MPSGYFGTVVISSSDEGVLSNGGDGVANIGDAAGYPTSQSFSFTAKAAGSCTIKAYCTVEEMQRATMPEVQLPVPARR